MLFEDGSSVAEIDRRAREQTTVEPNAWTVPVGFVSAAESKEAVLELATPHIVARGRKGGSPIAVAIIHARLLLSAVEGRAS